MYKQKITPETISIFPSIVVAALTNVCTHKCNHCQYKYYSTASNYKQHHMSMNVFKKIVQDMENYKGTALRLCAWGEPLLHPNIIEFLKYASSKKVKTLLLSNGYPLSTNLSYDLMNAGLDFIEISIDTAQNETYQKVRSCDDPDAFYKVIKNVNEMIQCRNKNNFSTKIVVSYVTWPNGESEKEFTVFKEKFQGFTDDVVKRRLHSFMCAVDPGLIKVPDDRLPCYGL